MMNILKKNIDIILLTFVLLFFIGDTATSILHKLRGGYFSRYSGIVKLLFEVIMCLIILANIKNQKRFFIGLMLLVLSFLVSQLLLDVSGYNFHKEFLEGNIYFFNRYMYIFIFILFTKSILIKEETYKKAYIFLEYFLYVNVIAVILGALFEIELFKSYEYTDRFGFSGLLAKPGEASYLYMIVIIFNYYFWIATKKSKNLYKMFFFIVFSLLLGQKKMLLFLGLFGLLHFIYYSKYRNVYRVGFPIVLGLLFVFRKSVLDLFIMKFPFWNKIYEKDGLLSMLSSYRNILLEEAIEYINLNWTFGNYIFGGIDFKKYKVEFEFIDLYIFLGVAGVLYYVFILISFLQNKNLLKKQLVCIVFLTSFASGGLILNVTAIVLFYIVIEKVLYVNSSKNHEHIIS